MDLVGLERRDRQAAAWHDHGAADFVAKPVDLNVLKRQLEEMSAAAT
jgi:FixJ family two-component response regulator